MACGWSGIGLQEKGKQLSQSLLGPGDLLVSFCKIKYSGIAEEGVLGYTLKLDKTFTCLKSVWMYINLFGLGTSIGGLCHWLWGSSPRYNISHIFLQYLLHSQELELGFNPNYGSSRYSVGPSGHILAEGINIPFWPLTLPSFCGLHKVYTCTLHSFNKLMQNINNHLHQLEHHIS